MMKLHPQDWQPHSPIVLEPDALMAVKSGQSVAVAAGPGTGKTELLSQRACFLLQTRLCPAPKRILALSFKTDAARNLKERVALRCGKEAAERFDSYTFHAFAKRILDRFRLALPPAHRPVANYAIGNGKWPGCIQFPNLLELAHKIFQETPSILRAFQVTYTHAFLDEFQDCTKDQYDILKTLLDGSQIVFTAVGDSNQSIMGFAGALPQAFQHLVEDYRLGPPLEIQINRRSQPYLQEVQRSILHAKERTGAAFTPGCATGGEASLYRFPSCAEELAFLTSLPQRLDAAGLCYLVRNRVTANGLVENLAKAGIPFRDERQDIQDLLSEPITDCILAWLRLCIQECPRSRERLYGFADNVLGFLEEDTRHTRALERNLEKSLTRFRSQAMINDQNQGSFREGLDWLLREFLGLRRIQATWPQYGQGGRLHGLIKSCRDALLDARRRSANWLQALDLLEGVGTCRIMTIHKCKGLEFDSVVVVGLEDQTFSNSGSLEDWCCFYVAASRAKSRLWFTTANVRNGRPCTFDQVAPFYAALQQADVQNFEFDD